MVVVVVVGWGGVGWRGVAVDVVPRNRGKYWNSRFRNSRIEVSNFYFILTHL